MKDYEKLEQRINEINAELQSPNVTKARLNELLKELTSLNAENAESIKNVFSGLNEITHKESNPLSYWFWYWFVMIKMYWKKYLWRGFRFIVVTALLIALAAHLVKIIVLWFNFNYGLWTL